MTLVFIYLYLMSYCHFYFFSIYAITSSICSLVFLTIYLIIIVSMIDTTKITDITIIFVEKSLIKNSTMNGKQKINVLIIAVVNIIQLKYCNRNINKYRKNYWK